MGPTESACLQDASTPSGPLWCIPVLSGIAAVWCDVPNGYQIETIETSRGEVRPARHHRVHSPYGAVQFHIVASDGLQDGSGCRIVMSDDRGGRITQLCETRLAHWKAPGASLVLSFVIGRLLPTLEGSGDYTPLVRYLSLVSAWRISLRSVADLGVRSVHELDATPGLLPDSLSCFLLVDGGIRQEHAPCLPLDGRTAILLPPVRPSRGYAEIGGELVELDFADGQAFQDRSIAWARALPRPTVDRLFDFLSDAVAEEGCELAPFWTALLPSYSVPLAEPGAAVRVEGCFAVPGRMIMLVSVAGTFSLAHPIIRLFGADRDGSVATVAARLDPPGANAGASPITRTVIVIGCDMPSPIACRLEGDVAGQSFRCWNRVSDGAAREAITFARTFWPNADRDDLYQSEVIAPLAGAWAGRSPAGHRPVLTFGLPSLESAVDLQIVGDGNLPSLHNTLIGLRSSQRSRQPIHISLHSVTDAEKSLAEIARWLDRYDLDGRIEILPLAEAPAGAARLRRPGQGRTSLALRAGFIPPHPAWATEILQVLEANPQRVLIGCAPQRHRAAERGAPNGSDACRPIGTEHLLELLQAGDLAAIAVPDRLLEQVRTRFPVCHTAMGAWAEWLCCASEQNVEVAVHTGLAVWDTNPHGPDDPLPLRIDAANLRLRRDLREVNGPQLAVPGSCATAGAYRVNSLARDETHGVRP